MNFLDTPCTGYLTPDGRCVDAYHPIATMPPLPPVIEYPMPHHTYTPTAPVAPPVLADTGMDMGVLLPVAVVLALVGFAIRALSSSPEGVS